MVAVPTRELSGQALASASGRLQARLRACAVEANESGRVTSARFNAACSGSRRSVVESGTRSRTRVAPGAPSEPCAEGVKASRSHPVGVNVKLFWAKVAGAPYELTRANELAGAHDVGIRMKEPRLVLPRSVSRTQTQNTVLLDNNLL